MPIFSKGQDHPEATERISEFCLGESEVEKIFKFYLITKIM